MRWSDYLSWFHQERAGITEEVLSRCHDRRGATPYDWLWEPVGDRTPVLDLACGSAPLWSKVDRSPAAYLGVDRSAAELALAVSRGAGPLVRVDAAALPLADRTVTVVVCAMALILLEPLPRAVAEIARVLRPGGRLVAIVPASRPLTARDALVAGGLVATAGRLSYPNDAALVGELDAAGLRLVGDEARRFGYRLAGPATADVLLDSLYLPGRSRLRIRAARSYLRALARVHATVPVPIRRLVVRRNAPDAPRPQEGRGGATLPALDLAGHHRDRRGERPWDPGRLDLPQTAPGAGPWEVDENGRCAVVGVRDLLARFRPAGAPGPAGAVGVPGDRRESVAAELAPVFAVLAEAEAACDRLRRDAAEQAARQRAAATEQARVLLAHARAGAAAERAAAAARIQEDAAAELAQLAAAATTEAEEVRRRAAGRLPRQLSLVLERVHADLAATGGAGDEEPR